MSWLSEAYSMWWEALLSLDVEQRALVLPQLNVPGLDSPWKALAFLRSDGAVLGGGRLSRRRRGRRNCGCYVK